MKINHDFSYYWTKLLWDISKVLEFNFFTLFLTDAEQKNLADLSKPKDKLNSLTINIAKLKQVNFLLRKNLKDKEQIISLLLSKKVI